MSEKSDSLFTALKIFWFPSLKKQKSLKLRSECARVRMYVCMYIWQELGDYFGRNDG